MVEILLGPETQARKCQRREAPFSFATSSALAPPATCPTIILNGLSYMAVADETEADEELSTLFSESGFNLIAGIMDGGCYIDSHSKFTSYAIGARVDLLERRCGAGWYLLQLLDDCPIPIWDPRFLYDHAKHMFNLDFHKCTSRWLWEDPTQEWDRKFPACKSRLPQKLRKLCTDVEKASADPRMHELWLGANSEYPDNECAQIPAIVLSWWDNIHWYNGQCRKNPSFTIEHGTNPVFAIMDSYAESTLQTGATHMGSPIYHDLDDVRTIVELAKPYAKLIDYLSHDEEECGFNCIF